MRSSNEETYVVSVQTGRKQEYVPPFLERNRRLIVRANYVMVASVVEAWKEYPTIKQKVGSVFWPMQP